MTEKITNSSNTYVRKVDKHFRKIRDKINRSVVT